MYECIDAINKTNKDWMLSLTTGATRDTVSWENKFWIMYLKKEMINNVAKWSEWLKQWLHVVQVNKIYLILETNFYPKNNKPTFFAVIVTKPVDIVFKKTIDKIK